MTNIDPTAARRKYVPAVGPKLNRLLVVVFGLFALLTINAVYLVVIRAAGWATGKSYENLFYLYMFLAHLVLGLVIVVPVIVFGALHMRNARNRRNRRAVRVGYALFAAAMSSLDASSTASISNFMFLYGSPIRACTAPLISVNFFKLSFAFVSANCGASLRFFFCLPWRLESSNTTIGYILVMISVASTISAWPSVLS